MKILQNYNIINNYNYRNSLSQRNYNITFRGHSETGDTINFSNAEQQDTELDAKLHNANIKYVCVEGNKAIIENLNGKFSEVEIPEAYFEGVEDRQKEVEKWLISLNGHPTLGVPYELLDIMDILNIETSIDEHNRRKLGAYHRALANGIRVINYDATDNIANIEIEGKPYKFLLNQMGTRQVFSEELIHKNSKLNQMISNIRESLCGKVYTIGDKDVLIPNILNRVPDVKNDENTVLQGNTTTEISDIYNSCSVLEEYSKKMINKPEKEIKTIRYMIKPYEGYDNIRVLKAYSYYDKRCDKLYLYKPEENIIQVLYNNNYVKNHSTI